MEEGKLIDDANAKGHVGSKGMGGLIWATKKPALQPFPCDLTKVEELKTLKLIGQIHNEEAEKRVDEDVLRAKTKKDIRVGIEGFYCAHEEQGRALNPGYGLPRNSVDVLVGFEDPFTFGLGILVQTFLGVTEGLATQDDPFAQGYKTRLARHMGFSPFLKEAWTNLRGQASTFNEREESIARVIDGIFSMPSEAKERLQGLENHPWTLAHRDFLNVVDAWLLSYVKMAQSPKYKESKQVPYDIDETVKKFLMGRNKRETVQSLLVDWRNPFLAQNIGRLYCQALAAGQGLHIHVGGDHLPGLQNMLLEMAGGTKLPLEVDDTQIRAKAVGQIENTNRQLQGIAAPRPVGEQSTPPMVLAPTDPFQESLQNLLRTR